MLRIPISGITEAGLGLDEVVQASALPLLKALSKPGLLRFHRPVHTRCRAVPAGATILIDGVIETGVHLACGRCLEMFDLAIGVDFSVTAVSQAPAAPDDDAADASIELSAADVAVLVYRGDGIDLRDEIGQQVIMALPVKPLCRESCKGLCSHCGADLNRSDCGCRQTDPDSPFARLKVMTVSKKVNFERH